MPSPRQRVMQSLNFSVPDRVPKDLAGMRSTGISAFAYPKLVAALGLPPRLPRVYDSYQMLALPDLDVLDALDTDVVTVGDGVTNAFEEAEKWHPYDFNGRLPALVRAPETYRTDEGGTIHQFARQMPPSSYVFDDAHGGQPVYLEGDLPTYDLKEYAAGLREQELRDDQIVALRDLCRRTREATDRAVFFSGPGIGTPICIHGHGGMAVFPMLCVTEPDYVTELHEIAVAHTSRNLRRVLPEIAGYVDIIMMAADDWGTQNSTIASPNIYRTLFLPYRRRLNDLVHQLAPGVKTFLHSCGAIYTLLDMIADSGFDIVNPAQWPAGGHSYQEWKDRCRGKLALWGGGLNSQHTLPLGSLQDVTREVQEIVPYMMQDGGYVFCNIHNLLAEIPPEKVIAIYQAAAGVQI